MGKRKWEKDALLSPGDDDYYCCKEMPPSPSWHGPVVWVEDVSGTRQNIINFTAVDGGWRKLMKVAHFLTNSK